MTADELKSTIQTAIKEKQRVQVSWTDGDIKVIEPASIDTEAGTTITVACSTVAEEGSPPDAPEQPEIVELNATDIAAASLLP